MTAGKTATFAEHIQELRSRLMWSVLFVMAGAIAGYMVHGMLLEILQRPLNDTLYYTTPTGAFSFVVKICLVFGIVVALPVIIYHVFAFFGPLIKARSKRIFAGYVAASFVFACLGMLFAYYVSLPAALKFLVNFGSNAGNVESLITANEYFNFVLAYIAGFAALFQLPLVLLFINKLTPLSPSKLIGSTRYVVIGSFIAAAVITPTPDPFNQALMAVPVVLLYAASAVVVMLVNRSKFRKRTESRDWLDLPDAAIDTMLHEAEGTFQQMLQPFPQLQPVPVVDDETPPVSYDPTPPPDYSVAPSQPLISDIGVRSRGRPMYQPRPAPVPPKPRLISDFVPSQSSDSR